MPRSEPKKWRKKYSVLRVSAASTKATQTHTLSISNSHNTIPHAHLEQRSLSSILPAHTVHSALPPLHVHDSRPPRTTLAYIPTAETHRTVCQSDPTALQRQHTLITIMSDKKPETKEAPKTDVEQPREPQPPSSPSQRQQSSSPQPTSPVTSSSRAVTFKTSAQPAEDAVSGRKREREGSLEPSQLTPSREPIPAKKNRVEDSLQEEEDDTDTQNQAETEKVGQIRKKVDELSTHELKTAQTASTNSSESVAAEAKDEVAAETVTAKDSTSESKKESTSTDQPGTETQPAKASQDPPARTQPTFSAFSSKSSPFSAVPSSSGSSSSSSKSGFSAFAARSASPLVRSGIKPSSLGSSIGGHHAENGSTSPAAAASSSSSKPIAKGSSFGFGAFAGASPLAKAKVKAPATSEKESDKPESSTDKDTFEQKLLSESKDDAASSENKSKPLLETPEAGSKSPHSHQHKLEIDSC